MQLWGIQDTFHFHGVDFSTFLILCVTNKRFWCPCLCSDLKQHYDGWSTYSALMLKLELFQKWNSIQVLAKLLQAVTRDLSLQLNTWLRWGCEASLLAQSPVRQVKKKKSSSASKSLCSTAQRCLHPAATEHGLPAKGALMKAVLQCVSWLQLSGRRRWVRDCLCSGTAWHVGVCEGRPYHCVGCLFCF